MQHDHAVLYVAGAAQGNPGPAGAGAIVLCPESGTCSKSYRYLGSRTCNQAEYEALLMGLRRALRDGLRRVLIHSSSELMINQLKGRYAVNSPSLLALHEAAIALLRRFDDWHADYLPRAANRPAHSLATKGIETRPTPIHAAPT